MSRIAKLPINIPESVEVKVENNTVLTKGKLGSLNHNLHPYVVMDIKEKVITFNINANNIEKKNIKSAWAQSGTARAIINNMIIGVDKGFEKKLAIFGVGYRAEIKNNKLNLSLGYSHPVNIGIPEDIKVVANSNTELTVSGIDKARVGQFCAEIRAKRPPNAYKGKGVRYKDEKIVLKTTKKK